VVGSLAGEDAEEKGADLEKWRKSGDGEMKAIKLI